MAIGLLKFVKYEKMAYNFRILNKISNIWIFGNSAAENKFSPILAGILTSHKVKNIPFGPSFFDGFC